MTTGLHADINPLLELLSAYPRWAVLTGAGCSTGSGIPDYRDADGEWKRAQPMRYQEFIATDLAQKRYWARAMLGWEQIRDLQPNAAHYALSTLQAQGRIGRLITQNVDGLHSRAGSADVIDLHGRMDQVECLACRALSPRADIHAEFVRQNPGWLQLKAASNPDGDTALEADFSTFRLVPCADCGGALKPAVVYFGETVPAPRVQQAYAEVEQSQLLLVVGSSLMVYSGYRFVGAARQGGRPVVIINRGRTRADAEATLKIDGDCGEVLQALAAGLGQPAAALRSPLSRGTQPLATPRLSSASLMSLPRRRR